MIRRTNIASSSANKYTEYYTRGAFRYIACVFCPFVGYTIHAIPVEKLRTLVESDTSSYTNPIPVPHPAQAFFEKPTHD